MGSLSPEEKAKFTPQMKEKLLRTLSLAEPYDRDDPILEMWDGESDPLRLAATSARDTLEKYGELPEGY